LVCSSHETGVRYREKMMMQVNLNDELLQHRCPYSSACRESPTLEHLSMHRHASMNNRHQSSIDWMQCRYNTMHMIPRVEIKLHEKYCTSKSLHDQILASMSDGKVSMDEQQQRCISVDSGYVGGGASSQHISPANSQVFRDDEKPTCIYVDPTTNQLYGEVEVFGDDDDDVDRPSMHFDARPVISKALSTIPLNTPVSMRRGRGRGRIKV